MSDPNTSKSKKERRTLYVDEWPEADRLAWQDACRPSYRLKKGGSASHLATPSLDSFASRYGLFLGFLKHNGRLNREAPATGHVTPENVEAYIANLTDRKVRSVTTLNCIHMLRRVAELLAPKADFTWLSEIEKDLALLAEPRSKLDRLVLSDRLVEAGLTLIEEAKVYTHAKFKRARGIRNGLMLALLALCPIRLKNFAALEIGTSFRQVKGRWWIVLPGRSTKMRSPEERPIPEWLTPQIELYLNEARPILLDRSQQPTERLWITSVTRGPMKKQNVGVLIAQITQETLGVRVSPHLFRTSGATTAAEAFTDFPHLASALLGHKNTQDAEEHYNRASSLNAASKYAEIIRSRCRTREPQRKRFTPTALS
jgi:integrase